MKPPGPPDLPGPHQPFNVGHMARWPMGAERVEMIEGELVWAGEFDERDAVVARRTFPGHRVSVQAGLGLTVGVTRAEHPEQRQWTDQDGTQWHQLGGMLARRSAGERNWTVEPWTDEERRSNREQVAASRAEEWTETVAAYAAHPADVVSAWRYLSAHPIFWSWVLPRHLEGMDSGQIDEAVWARVQAEGWLNDSDGLAGMELVVDGSGDSAAVMLEHGPVLWPLDVPAQHRMGFRAAGTPSHDPRIDVREPTWERAIVALAARVREAYGDDRSRVPDPPPAHAHQEQAG